ncbi:restriction endonuclease [Macrococcus lamae]|uniref:Restriction endonuclease type IV Mrr domain-containing protein n=1 Tax=Macrococcus lamae TaxID=198484 RepID=A0A4R6BTL2_9STAP|nr:restriction endonuclease [Macrococcus lamae]TDM07523.1 hypothetical protein ERX29_08800 [Macrococcus lamae]
MYLIHRISHEKEAAKNLLGVKGDNKRYLSIGWGSLKEENKQKLLEAAQQGKEQYRATNNEIGHEGLTGQRSWFLYNFLALNKGDTVVVPTPGEISVYQVTDKPKSYTSEGVDLGFIVPVKEIEEKISRKDYVTGPFHRKLKYRGSNLVLTGEDYKYVDEVINNFQNKVKVTDAITKTKAKMAEIAKQYIEESLTDITFEQLIKHYFYNIGATSVTIPSKKIKNNKNNFIADIDVKATFEKLKIIILVQAKLHQGMDDPRGMEQLFHTKVENEEGFYQIVKWLITTGEVSEDVLNEPLYNGIRVIQKNDFAELLVESGFDF